MFEHFYVILWIYTQNQSHRSGTTSLLRQREAGGLWTHLCCWAQTVLQLRPPRVGAGTGFSQDRAKCSHLHPVLLGVPFSSFHCLCTISTPSGWDVLACCAPKPLGISPCCVSCLLFDSWRRLLIFGAGMQQRDCIASSWTRWTCCLLSSSVVCATQSDRALDFSCFHVFPQWGISGINVLKRCW